MALVLAQLDLRRTALFRFHHRVRFGGSRLPSRAGHVRMPCIMKSQMAPVIRRGNFIM